MALQNTGQISIKNIADEFGDSAPHALSEFRGKGSIPASGEAKVSRLMVQLTLVQCLILLVLLKL